MSSMIFVLNKVFQVVLHRIIPVSFFFIYIPMVCGPLPPPITARVETEPVPNARDAADDPLIWIHPDDTSQSTVIGNDKLGAFEVYDLSGRRLQTIPIDTGNTDVRYNFPLGGEQVDLVAGYSATSKGLVAWKVNPATRQLEEVTAPGAEAKPGGGTMYHSLLTGEYYWFSNDDGTLYQYRLFDNGLGQVASELVRTIQYGQGQAEGAVADDEHAVVYVSLEKVGLWRLSAEPDSNEQFLVDKPDRQGGHFTPDLEGLAIYYRSDGGGYLFASSQGSSSYNIYQRDGDNAYIGTFSIQDDIVDGTSDTDGIEVTGVPLGPDWPYGLFVAQDGNNMNSGVRTNQNFKLVPFDRIAKWFGLALDTSWNPRAVGR